MLRRTMTTLTASLIVLVCCLDVPVKAAKPEKPKSLTSRQVDVPARAIATLYPTKGNDARGVVLFTEGGDGVHIRGRIEGLAPGKHGFHVHEFGDLSAADGTSAGGHFAPRGHKHGAPDAEEHHYGDLGNVEANAEGVASFEMTADWMKLHFVIGRAMVVHAKPDDFGQPTGNAGARVAVGVIGIADPKSFQGDNKGNAK